MTTTATKTATRIEVVYPDGKTGWKNGKAAGEAAAIVVIAYPAEFDRPASYGFTSHRTIAAAYKASRTWAANAIPTQVIVF